MNCMLKIREKIFKKLFLAGDFYRAFAAGMARFCRFVFIITLFLFILTLIFYIGFSFPQSDLPMIDSSFRIFLIVMFIARFLPLLMQPGKRKLKLLIFDGLLFLFSFLVIITFFSQSDNAGWFTDLFAGVPFVITAVILLSISEISSISGFLGSVRIEPALVFAGSFLIIILAGTGLLMLPNAKTVPLSFLDSLFTSVSAVCVTGLTVTDTASSFTELGKIIIMCLIQVGGLGIMTFTVFFGFVFTGGTSFREKLLLKDVFSAESLNNLIKVLAKILFFTFLTELVGAFLIFSSLDSEYPGRIIFSVFHSVSAFCNAGFSTLTGNLNDGAVISNHPVHLIVAFLIILGGIGFPVLLQVYSRLKHFLIVIVRRLRKKRIPVKPEKLNLAARIVLITTFLLITGGTILYFLFETKTSLQGLTPLRKIIISFFGSVSSRTAGFNITDLTLWGYPTTFLMILLMWIGASPGSTGGGIKTTTFAVAIRSAWFSIRGKEHLVIGNRELGFQTVSRVLSIIILSIIIIFSGFLGLLLSEPGKNPVHLLFEAVSAFSTVGLSIANTASFTPAGKWILIVLMFTGRLGPLTLFTGLFITHRKSYSRYPVEEININ